jgi:hypothetical protein
MKVVVDTAVWSLALRRAKRVDDTITRELTDLIHDGRVIMLGPIRQELLSGVKERSQFETLRDHLRAFPDVELEAEDFEEAAESFNACRQRGIQGSNTDFLICAAARRRKAAVYSTDRDFQQYAKVLALQLHAPRA